MAEPTRFMFDLKEVVQLLIKQQGIKDGHWALAVQFGLSAAQINANQNGVIMTRPAAIVPVVSLGLNKLDAPTDASVDASKRPPAIAKKKAFKEDSELKPKKKKKKK